MRKRERIELHWSGEREGDSLIQFRKIIKSGELITSYHVQSRTCKKNPNLYTHKTRPTFVIKMGALITFLKIWYSA
jgi:hypothetical protein